MRIASIVFGLVLQRMSPRGKNRSLRGHVLTSNECYTINIVYVIVDMLL